MWMDPKPTLFPWLVRWMQILFLKNRRILLQFQVNSAYGRPSQVLIARIKHVSALLKRPNTRRTPPTTSNVPPAKTATSTGRSAATPVPTAIRPASHVPTAIRPPPQFQQQLTQPAATTVQSVPRFQAHLLRHLCPNPSLSNRWPHVQNVPRFVAQFLNRMDLLWDSERRGCSHSAVAKQGTHVPTNGTVRISSLRPCATSTNELPPLKVNLQTDGTTDQSLTVQRLNTTTATKKSIVQTNSLLTLLPCPDLEQAECKRNTCE